MKKMWTLPLALLLLLALAGCSAKAETGETLFDLDKAARVVYHGGDSHPGMEFEIEDEEMIGELRDMFYAPTYEKVKPSGDYDGCGDVLGWYDADGRELAAIDIKTQNYVDYDGAFYSLSGGVINMSLIREQLAEAYPFNKALENAVKVYIEDGHTGETVKLEDPEKVDILKDLLSRVHMEKAEYIHEVILGYHYHFIWYDENGEEICNIPNVNETVISYGNWFWNVVESPAGPIEETIEKVFDQELGQLVLPLGSSIIGDGFVEKNGIDCVWISTPEKEAATQNRDHVYNSVRAFSGVRVRETGPASEEDYKNYAYKVAWGKKGGDYEGIGLEIIIREDGALVYDGAVYETMSQLNGKYVTAQYLDEALEDPEGSGV